MSCALAHDAEPDPSVERSAAVLKSAAYYVDHQRPRHVVKGGLLRIHRDGGRSVLCRLATCGHEVGMEGEGRDAHADLNNHVRCLSDTS